MFKPADGYYDLTRCLFTDVIAEFLKASKSWCYRYFAITHTSIGDAGVEMTGSYHGRGHRGLLMVLHKGLVRLPNA